MKIISIVSLALLISHTAEASPEKPLNTIMKGNTVCIYTDDKKSQPYNGRIYVYIGEVHPDKYINGYDKLYKNIKTPINPADCIGIDASHFKSNIPYDISLDMLPTYATRICLDKSEKPFVIKEVVNGFECASPVEKKAQKGFWQRLLDW